MAKGQEHISVTFMSAAVTTAAEGPMSGVPAYQLVGFF